MSAETLLAERDWRNLLREIHARQVIPVVGPELVTVEENGQSVPLVQHLAPKLARQLNLSDPDSFRSVSAAARAWLLGGGDRKEVYDELRDLVDGLEVTPSPALLDLAAISDFHLYVCSSFDPFMVRALEQARPGFAAKSGSLAYHPTKPADLPVTPGGPMVYHIMGDYNTYPDFAVWDEDYMEFLCGLLEQSDTLENLFRMLKGHYLLLLGAPSEDWVVRFFLRMARQQRLSERHQRDYLADRCERLGEPMVFFFDKLVGATRIIDGDPGMFVHELARRWREKFLVSGADSDFLESLPEEMPRGSVFISYSRDDLEAAARLGRGLARAQIPVWIDRQRLQAGDNYERSLEHAVKDGCSYFLSLISPATEANASRYVHRERQWASQKHVDGFVYYVPVVLDAALEPKLEPACFDKIHREVLPGGEVTPAFAGRMKKLVEEFRTSGRPRG
ncbi:MAG: toll/interleukin-1 receptor domain-containing protein [Verrucomicrobiales bacterium]|nr:toll/interleukin-1 receptor domain-containing protein [Verrucomicrobiales bacterium]